MAQPRAHLPGGGLTAEHWASGQDALGGQAGQQAGRQPGLGLQAVEHSTAPCRRLPSPAPANGPTGCQPRAALFRDARHPGFDATLVIYHCGCIKQNRSSDQMRHTHCLSHHAAPFPDTQTQPVGRSSAVLSSLSEQVAPLSQPGRRLALLSSLLNPAGLSSAKGSRSSF